MVPLSVAVSHPVPDAYVIESMLKPVSDPPPVFVTATVWLGAPAVPAVSANVRAAGASPIEGGATGAVTLNVIFTLPGLLVTPLAEELTKTVASYAPGASEIAFAVTVSVAGAVVPLSVALSHAAPDA